MERENREIESVYFLRPGTRAGGSVVAVAALACIDQL